MNFRAYVAMVTVGNSWMLSVKQLSDNQFEILLRRPSGASRRGPIEVHPVMTSLNSEPNYYEPWSKCSLHGAREAPRSSSDMILIRISATQVLSGSSNFTLPRSERGLARL